MPREQSGAISSKHTLTSGRCINSRNITPASPGLCIKVGRGHRDACVGTGTWERETRDLRTIKYGTRGRVGRGRGDVKNRDAGDAGCE